MIELLNKLNLQNISYSGCFKILGTCILIGIVIHAVTILLPHESYVIEDNYHIAYTKPHNFINGIGSLVIIGAVFVLIILITSTSTTLACKGANDYVAGVKSSSEYFASTMNHIDAVHEVTDDFKQLGGNYKDKANNFEKAEEVVRVTNEQNEQMLNELLTQMK